MLKPMDWKDSPDTDKEEGGDSNGKESEKDEEDDYLTIYVAE